MNVVACPTGHVCHTRDLGPEYHPALNNYPDPVSSLVFN
jgi:hypothetical protein